MPMVRHKGPSRRGLSRLTRTASGTMARITPDTDALTGPNSTCTARIVASSRRPAIPPTTHTLSWVAPDVARNSARNR